MSKFYKLSVKEVHKETESSVSVVFDIPENLKSEFSFIPGQFINIKKELNGEELHRSYSICSSPNSNVLRIGIKAVENGAFSVFAVGQLKSGDILEVSPPEGRFVLHADSANKKSYLAFAAGSGITPILSMVRSVLETETHSTFVLVYGNKSPEMAMFKSEIDSLAAHYGSQFFIHYMYSQTHENDALFGRIDTSISNYIVKNTYKEISFDDIFLCGPEDMIYNLKDHFLADGFSEEHLHFELFATKTEPMHTFDDLTGEAEVTVILDEEETTFSMPRSKTILEMALLKGLDAPYSCQGGICSTCLAQVEKGRVIMDKNTILNEEEVRDGLVLTCQSHPVTETVIINYDAV
ncbi:MAG: ferredoxin--NADP reductase [Flavobacteriaceae bacterium]|nr:ferredoxin--NADP reductase [Flavobacteriaceae bacterium]